MEPTTAGASSRFAATERARTAGHAGAGLESRSQSPIGTIYRCARAALEIDALSLAQPAVFSAELLDRFQDVLLEDLNGLDPAFDSWLGDERARFQRIGRTIGESLLAKCEDPVAVIDAAEQLLSIDRMHEGAWRAVMRGHADRGDPSERQRHVTTAVAACWPNRRTGGRRQKPRI